MPPPAASADVLKETWPLELRGACASTVLPCAKVTCPVGVPVAGGTAETVAVKVTLCPVLDGSGDKARTVEEAPLWITCTNEALPGLKLASPLYCTVMKCSSAVRDELVNVALPLASRGTLEASVTLVVCKTEFTTAYVVSVKVAVPVGMMPEVPVLVIDAVPEVPVLVIDAVKVSDRPTTAERTSGVEEVTATPTPLRFPKAHSELPLRVKTVPSGPITMGT